nr:hypothetical protein [Actinomadura sp. BRA 177]
MGGEGAMWVGAAPFRETGHMSQNLGDGTFFHPGSPALRQAVAPGPHIATTLLHNPAPCTTADQQRATTPHTHHPAHNQHSLRTTVGQEHTAPSRRPNQHHAAYSPVPADLQAPRHAPALTSTDDAHSRSAPPRTTVAPNHTTPHTHRIQGSRRRNGRGHRVCGMW